MPDLHTEYLGMTLRSPIVASAGPYTGDLDRLAELEQSGIAAVVLPSLFEEQIEHETTEIDRLFSLYGESFGEATSYLPELDDYNTGVDTYLALVAAAKQRVDVPVIASLNGTNIGGWIKYAALLEDAGADAIELNLYSIAADPHVTGFDLEAQQRELVALVVEEVNVPVAVKISPFYSAVASFAVELQKVGAAGLTMFNRFYLPDLDLETLDIEPRIALSTPEEVRLPLRWAAILRPHLTMSIAASTGVHSGDDVAKLVLAGADVAMATSSLLRNGTAHVATIEARLVDWMDEHEYESVSQMRGAVSRDSVPDPEAYERANYIGNLASYTSRFRGTTPIALRRR